jgi:hypothetical protein
LTLKKSRGWSNGVIAEVVGVNEWTVRNDLISGSGFPEPEIPARVTGKDGKSYPAKMPRTVNAKTQDEAASAMVLLNSDGWVDDECNARVLRTGAKCRYLPILWTHSRGGSI